MSALRADQTARAVASGPSTNGDGEVGRSGSLLNLPFALSFLGMATVGFNTIRIGEWSVSDLLFLLAVGAIIMMLLSGGRRGLAPVEIRRSPPILFVGTLILLTAGTLSSFWAFNPVGSIGIVLRYAWLTLAWFWALRAVSPNYTAVGALVQGYKVTTLVSAVAAIVGDMGVVQVSPDNWSGRQAGFFGHPNSLAALLTVGLPFFLADVPRPPDRPEGRSIAYRLAMAGFVVIAVGTTGSMTGLLGSGAAVVVMGCLMVVARDRRRRRIHPLTTMTLAVIVGAAIYMFAQSDAIVIQRLSAWLSGDGSVTSSVDSRDEQRDVVLERLDERLVLGVGFDMETTLADSGDDTLEVSGGVHNMYVKLLYEGGFVALVGLLIITIATIRRAWLMLFFTRGTTLYPLTLALWGSLTAATVNALFQPVLVRRYYWLPIALIWVLWALCRYVDLPGRARSRPAEPATVDGG